MSHRQIQSMASFVIIMCLSVVETGAAPQHSAAEWHDPSPHRVQMVPVGPGVAVEVLDWGGTGRPVILLAGLGNTAHVFDDLAPKLASMGHVYGVTRRGFGSSSAPATGYAADRLGDDVLAVVGALNITKPVLVGHSIAGEELTSIGTRHPEAVTGLVYLEAAYPYAYYDATHGDLDVDVAEFRRTLTTLAELRSPQLSPSLQTWRKLVASIAEASDADDLKTAVAVTEMFDRDRPAFEEHLRAWDVHIGRSPTSPTAARGHNLINTIIVVDLPALRKGLGRLEDDLRADTPRDPDAAPTAKDRASFGAFRAWQLRVEGVAVPEAELRQIYVTRANGGIGRLRFQAAVPEAVEAGVRRFGGVNSIPILAIYAVPDNAVESGHAEDQAQAFARGVPQARIVRMAHANHYVFLSNEADVLAEMSRFLREPADPRRP